VVLVLKITAGVLLAAVVLIVGCASLIVDTAENGNGPSGLADYGDKDRPITRAEYNNVKVGDPISGLLDSFGEPTSIIHGRKIARDQDDVYSWKMQGGGLLDMYQFDVDPVTDRVTAKSLF
jgi:hypothetical protein